MAVKTITIDIEAYTLLARRKREGESFSDVIKAHFGPLPTAGRFRQIIRTVRISEDALNQMEAQVRARRLHKARVIKL
jgi:predicted CopG family antitoxin